jgi:hypothetical protein
VRSPGELTQRIRCVFWGVAFSTRNRMMSCKWLMKISLSAIRGQNESKDKLVALPTLKDAEKFMKTAMQADVQQRSNGKSGLVLRASQLPLFEKQAPPLQPA